MQDNIIVIKFEDSKLPEFKEVKNKEWVQFGEGDDYPDYLLKLSKKSAKHAAIIKGKLKYIYGKGLKSTSENASLNEWIHKANGANEGIGHLVKKAILDIEVFGGFYWQIIPDLFGNIQEIYHIDFKKMRTNSDRSEFYYKKDWKDRKEAMKTMPKWVKGMKTAGIFSFREYMQGEGVYPLPEYISCLNWIEADYEVSKQTLSNAKTGFSASKFINFYDGEPESEEKKRDIERRFNAKFTGSDGKKIIIGFNNDPVKKPTIDDLGDSDLTKEDFTAVNDLITANIYAGHQITSPMLFGIQEQGKLGQSNELKYSYDIFKNTYASFKQEQIEDIINYFAEIIFGVADMKLQEVEPIGIPFTDQTIVQVAPIEWIWEKLGIDPAKYPNSKPASLPGTPGSTVPGSGTPAAAPAQQMVNDNIKNLSTKQHQQLMRIIRQFTKGQLSKEAATALLKAGLGLNDAEIMQLLGIEEDQQFDKEYTEEEAADMFAEVGVSKQSFRIVRTKKAKFTEEEFEAQEIFKSAQEATSLEADILAIIKRDNRISNATLADNLGVSVEEIDDAIKSLNSKGLIKVIPGKELIRQVVNTKKSVLPEVSVKYSYEKNPIAEGDAIIPGTRLFCRKLIELDRLYSRTEIQQISMKLGYSVWERRGGFWNNGKTTEPFCRHIWQAHVVIKQQ